MFLKLLYRFAFAFSVFVEFGGWLRGVPSAACLQDSCGKQAEHLLHWVCQVNWQPCSFLKGCCIYGVSGGLLSPRTREVEVSNPASLKMQVKTGEARRLSKCQITMAEV